MLHIKNPLLQAVYRECGGKAVTSRQGTAVGGERGCGSVAVPSGWPLGGLSTPLCWVVPAFHPALWNSARELWGLRKALQMNPMEEEASSLQGHAALSRLAGLALAWSVWEPDVQALQKAHLHCIPTKLIHISHIEMKVCPPIWVYPSR